MAPIHGALSAVLDSHALAQDATVMVIVVDHGNTSITKQAWGMRDAKTKRRDGVTTIKKLER